MAKALGPLAHGSHNLAVGHAPVREDRLLGSAGILAQHKLERCFARSTGFRLESK